MTVLFVVATILLFLSIDWISRKLKTKRAVVTSQQQTAYQPYPVRTPEGIYFAPSHTWLNLFPSGKVRLGIDDFVGRMIKEPQVILLKKNGEIIQKGDPIILLKDHDRLLTVRSPIEAEVLSINDQLEANPGLLKDLLFSGGWAYTLKPKRFADIKTLFLGPDTKTWMSMEFARLRDFFAGVTNNIELAPAMLQDGGPPVAGAMQSMNQEVWNQFEQEFLVVEERSL